MTCRDCAFKWDYDKLKRYNSYYITKWKLKRGQSVCALNEYKPIKDIDNICKSYIKV